MYLSTSLFVHKRTILVVMHASKSVSIMLHLITADSSEKTAVYLSVNILHQWNISWRTDTAVVGLSEHGGLNYDLRYTNESLLVWEPSKYAIEIRIYYREFKHNTEERGGGRENKELEYTGNIQWTRIYSIKEGADRRQKIEGVCVRDPSSE